MKTFLSVDLGAGSGRVTALRYDGARLRAETVHRFDNNPVELSGHIFWNIPSLMESIRGGLREARRRFGEIASVGVDSWGVDYAFLDKSGRMLGLPYAYRDARTNPANTERALPKLGGRRSLYSATGIQTLDFNTVFQLHAESEEAAPLPGKAARMLFTPDLINFLLCGEMANEATIASTSQMIDVRTRDWADGVLSCVGVPRHLLRTPLHPGRVLGKIRGVDGLDGAPLCLVGSHDTASAVASIPTADPWRCGYIATGTWALIGAQIREPVINEESLGGNWTHEGAADGSLRFLRNCTGMWIAQELRRAWADPATGRCPDFDTLMHEAQAAAPFRFFIDPDAPEFFTPGGMPRKVADFCRRTGQEPPQTRGEFHRAAMEGVIMRYREVWGELERLTGVRRGTVNVIGGAINDALHCRMAADALAMPLECGPAEGASIGNAIAQMVACGDLASFEEGRALCAASVDVARWEPGAGAAVWGEPFARWQQIKRNGLETAAAPDERG